MSRHLHDVADVYYGKSPREVIDADGIVPVLGTGGLYGHATQALFEGPAVVVPRKGTLGNPQYVEGPFWPVDTTYALLPKHGIDARWIYYCLDRFDLTRLNEATGVPSINREWLRKIPMGDAGSMEQKYIAEVILSVDCIIGQTEALIAKMQHIKAGLMHDLFTRGVMPNGQLRPPREEAPQLYKESPLGWIPREWSSQTVDELLAKSACPMRSGPFGSSLLKSEFVEQGVPLLGIDNVFPERFERKYSRFVTNRRFLELSRYAVFPRDVMVTIMGTVGRCCVIPDDIGRALSSKHLWAMTLNRDKVLPELVCWQLNYATWVKSWFARASQGAVMDAIQSSSLRELSLPTPPIREQERIRERYSLLSESVVAEEERSTKLHSIKLGLMHDLLTGRVRVPESMLKQPGAAE